MNGPQYFCWDGDVMRPLNARAADKQYVVHQEYRLVIAEERSGASHRQQFAEINEAWRNLPEAIAAEFPTPTHFRKRLLIDAGFYNQEIIDCGTAEAAERVAALVKHLDEYAVATVTDAVVIIRRAKSQAYRAMKKDEFQKSKTAILEIAATMVGVPVERLKKNAGKAA